MDYLGLVDDKKISLYHVNNNQCSRFGQRFMEGEHWSIEKQRMALVQLELRGLNYLRFILAAGFVETLVSAKVHPLTKKEEEQRQQQMKMMNKDSVGMEKQEEDDADHIIIKSNNGGLDLDPPHLCLLEQPHKDNGGKNMPKRTGVLDDISSRKEDVEIVGLSILCPGRPEISLSHPFISSPKACLFTLKEGTKYRLKFSFIVSNKIVTGLKYENTLWKAGVRIDRCTLKLGTFSPRENPYGYQLEEETLPSGMLVRGLYSARAKVVDSDGKCYMDIHYHFDIQKRWPSTS